MRELLDSDGENRAVRFFLMAYGSQSMTVEMMRNHMSSCGFALWPEWAVTPDAQGHLTKAGAQDWLRHLFGLESTHNAKSQATDAALSRQVACTDGLGVLGDKKGQR